MPTIGMSKFCRLNQTPGSGKSFTTLDESQLIQLVDYYWDHRMPGTGETDCSRKVLVPISRPDDASPICGKRCFRPMFFCGTTILKPGMPIKFRVTKRKGQEHEDPYVEKYISQEDADRLGIKPEEAMYVNIVCYSADALLENGGERSTDCEWEIVAILASPVQKEPMRPLVMARNQLGKPGGTKSNYTGDEFAEAVYYWASKIPIIKE